MTNNTKEETERQVAKQLEDVENGEKSYEEAFHILVGFTDARRFTEGNI